MVDIVNVVRNGLNPITASPKDTIPETSLLAIVIALLPTLAVVQVVVLDDKLGIEITKSPAKG